MEVVHVAQLSIYQGSNNISKLNMRCQIGEQLMYANLCI